MESFSPYGSMANDPINYLDPLGNFRNKIGAWLHRLFNDGGRIGENEFGEWYVEKTRTEATADGNATIVSYKYYGQGRNQYSSAGEEVLAEQEKKEFVDDLVEKGVLERNSSQAEANRKNFQAFAGVLMPKILKAGTIASNANKVRPLSKMNFKEVQDLAKLFRNELDLFFKSGGKHIPSKEALEAYKELTIRILNQSGGAPAAKASMKAIQVQSARLEMIEDALKT